MSMVATQTECYRELVNIRYVAAKERAMPWFRTIQWAWFIVPMLQIYGETLHKFCTEHRGLFWLTSITNYFSQLVYISYCVLFVFTVLTLKKGLVRFQISQFMWSLVTVFMVVVQCKFYASNVLSGIFWFFFPMATVVMNDVSAYFSGICFGRKFIKAPFIALSPNKTWEGFIGASVGTTIFSFFFPALLAQYAWLVCPADGLYIWPLPSMGTMSCEPNPVFIKTLITLPYIGETLLYPIQLHGLYFGLFASFVAPFGGFFASAIKRAYNKKDFETFFPGHGGLMDRMDCQFLMVSFTSFYYYSYIAPKDYGVDKLLFFASKLTPEHQAKLWEELGRQLGTLT
jgi:phosphatidate cytidylyltransferase